MAKAIMIQGTMSNAGKSLIAAGLCRIFKQDGYKVAPFKSQNMALNSYITKENLEMGRAQAVQAYAAGIEPSVLMNPILLKPTTDMGSQVIIMGEVVGNMRAMDYFKRKKDYIPVIEAAYDRLASEYDIVVIEGAGSPAEINLKQDDIVNMGMAKMADAPVLLVGDIDRGGVFAQLIGTVWLLEEEEKNRIKGLIINKFRGDRSILEPGLDMLTKKCGKSVLGIVPYMTVDIEEEDSLAESFANKDVQGEVVIAVIRLPKISNFTDFQAFSIEQKISLRYVDKVSQLGKPDAVILPGTKNTMQDMRFLRESGLEAAVLRLAKEGTIIFGICGGYQMLGKEIMDEEGVEGKGSIRGMGLLPMVTRFEKEKTRTRTEGSVSELSGVFRGLSGKKVSGYEIHMGKSVWENEGSLHKAPYTFLKLREKDDGICHENTLGTYLHGIFDEEEFRTAFIQLLCERKGISYHGSGGVSYEEYREQQLDKLAKELRESLDMEKLYEIMGIKMIDQHKAALKKVLPEEIEKLSFEIITKELGDVQLDPMQAPVIKRVIHTTADFDYLENLCFSKDAVKRLQASIREGACIVTDTQMAKAGINKKALAKYGSEVYCFMSDEDVAKTAKEKGSTRAMASMDKAANLHKKLIFVVGNAPTALVRLYELMQEGSLKPEGIIGVPVGFVNVVEAKELILQTDCPYIVARGRKGGSNVAAAICNALLYQM